MPKKVRSPAPAEHFILPEECTPADEAVRVEPDMSAVNRTLLGVGVVLIGLGVVVVVRTWQPAQLGTLIGGGAAGLAFVLVGSLMWTRLARFAVRDEWITIFDGTGIVQTRPSWFRWRRLVWERQRAVAVEYTATDVTVRAYPRDVRDLRPDELRFGYRELVFLEKVDEVLAALRGTVAPELLVEHSGHEIAVAANAPASAADRRTWPPRTWAGVAAAVLPALTLGFFYAELAGWVGSGHSLLLLPLLAFTIGARLVARSWFVTLGMAAVCGVYWIAAAFCTADLIPDFVLAARGETVTATAVGTLYDPSLVAVRGGGLRTCGRSQPHCHQGFYGIALVDPQGTRLRGGIPLPDVLREAQVGRKHEVVRDPRGFAPVRKESEILPVLDSILTVVPLAAFYLMATYTLRRRVRKQ